MYRGTDSDSDGESGTAATVSEQSLSSSRAASPSESIQSVQSVNEAFLESLLLNMRDAAGAAALRLGLVSSGSGASASNEYPSTSTAQAPATPSNRLFDIRGALNDATPSLGIGHLLSQHHNHHHNHHEHQQPSSKTVKLLGGRKRRTSTIDSMHNFEQDWQDRNEDNDNFRNSPHFESPEKMPQKDFLDLDFRDSKKLASMSSLFDADDEDRVDSDDLDELKLHASLPPSLAAWDSTPFVFGGTGLPSTFQNTHQQQLQHPFQHNPFHNQQNHQQMHHNQHQVFQSFQSSSLFQHPQASLSLPSASLFGATAPQQSFTPFSFDFANHSHQQQNNKHEQEQAAAKNLDIDSLFHQLLPPNQEQSSASLFDIRNTTHRTSPSIKRKTRNQTSSSSSTASATQPQHLPQRRASDAFLGIQNATASKSGRYPTRTKTTSGSSSSSSLDQMMEEDEQEDLAGSKTPFFSASSMPPIMANNAVDLNPFLDIGGIDEYLLGTAGAVGNVPGHGMNPFLIESGGGIGMMDLMNGTASDMMELETMFDPNLFGLAAPSQLLEDSMGEEVIKQEPVSIPTTATATATKASTKKYSRKRPTSSREMSATPKPEDFGHPSDEELPAIGPSTTARSKKTSTAVPGTVNRRAVKEYVNCMTCNAQLGVLELRGTVVGIAYQPQLQCTTCAPPSTPPPTSDPSTSDPAPKPRRKRTSTTKDAPHPHQKTHPAFPCLVCKTLKAHGHIINPQDPTTPTPVTATLVCPTCDTKYLFCAECGGGGKQRTGKYRPRALFPSTRKTCSLPHIRIGTAQVHTRVVAPPFGGGGGVGKGVLEGMKDVLFDCWVGALAVPGVLDGDGGDGGVLGLVVVLVGLKMC
ncbi:hypothetical protein BCR33DRAFT_533897 [Rhizoclosmatium globosum]|uniref:Uncharacterized protein n=1 Tax=Rhizoclosmatium globosum TaxID=329046 RepID=A0A1Y2BE41_9FUNG|nr:hypothetical protein BCR33DRAFT_533897 [Rhizoclosmatium globosum]|eukprot:ORY32757.1 hypothetical protein BCR33DRAFT_533897 [Rhizoclosmatium globosum]